jgi:hypothetical protein
VNVHCEANLKNNVEQFHCEFKDNILLVTPPTPFQKEKTVQTGFEARRSSYSVVTVVLFQVVNLKETDN